MRKSTTFALALGFSAMLAGTADAQLKMGLGAPFTGPNAAFGAQLKNGFDQAIEDINAKGGIQGQKITSSYGDDVSDPKQGVSVANKFAADGVKFIVGHFNSGVTIPASEVYQENGMIDITPAATNPKLTERNMWNVFRTCGRDDQQGPVAGEYVLKNYKGKKIAVVHDKTTYGQGLADEMKKTINKGGLKEVLFEGVNTGEKDYSALVSKIKQSGAELVYFGGLYTEGGLIVRQMRDQGVKAVAHGRRWHRIRRIRRRRRTGRRGDTDDLRTGCPQSRGGEGSRGEIPREEIRAGSLHALQLRRGGSAQAGGGRRQVGSTRRKWPSRSSRDRNSRP